MSTIDTNGIRFKLLVMPLFLYIKLMECKKYILFIFKPQLKSRQNASAAGKGLSKASLKK